MKTEKENKQWTIVLRNLRPSRALNMVNFQFQIEVQLTNIMNCDLVENIFALVNT